MKHYVVSTILLVGACGGSDLDPGAGSDPGGGTSTLVVEGSANAESRLTNGLTAADFDTDFSVRVTLNGQLVTTGTVSVTSASGTVDLLFEPGGNGNDRWRANAPGYDEVYILDVVSGEDTVEGVRVDGPDIHVFAEPIVGATVDATQPIDVVWNRADEAASASISTNEIDGLAIPDSGSHTLPMGSLKTERDKAQENTIRIRRENRIVPAGAAGGSEWSVSIRNELQVLAAPAP